MRAEDTPAKQICPKCDRGRDNDEQRIDLCQSTGQRCFTKQGKNTNQDNEEADHCPKSEREAGDQSRQGDLGGLAECGGGGVALNRANQDHNKGKPAEQQDAALHHCCGNDSHWKRQNRYGFQNGCEFQPSRRLWRTGWGRWMGHALEYVAALGRDLKGKMRVDTILHSSFG